MARNLPVPPGFNDSEMAYVLDAAILPLAERFAPQAVVLQCGADALDDDPMSRVSLSNLALWRVVAALRGLAPRLLVLGGGGYNPWSVGRCWTGVWAALNGFTIPDRLPPETWFTSLADRPRPGPVREAVRTVVAEVLWR